MTPEKLNLRDVQLPPAPSWWPPAPGWWLLAGAVLLVLTLVLLWVWRSQRQRQRWRQQFESELQAATNEAERLAVMSGLLRRAARRHHPGADLLQGEAWLQLLDGTGKQFSQGPGRVLLDGMYQPHARLGSTQQLQVLVQQRFVQLMAGRK